jgi:hypothetical protein
MDLALALPGLDHAQPSGLASPDGQAMKTSYPLYTDLGKE